jgi:predicted acylesterase/phospholipase RssA
MRFAGKLVLLKCQVAIAVILVSVAASSEAAQRNAFVLSAGGTHAAFEVGAVRYLYEHNIRPDVISGTSGGALNAVKLAEDGPKNADFAEFPALKALEQEWLSLRGKTQVYDEQPAFHGLSDVKKRVLELYYGWNTGDDISAITTLADLISSADDIKDAALAAWRDKSIYNLNPTETRLRHSVDAVKVQGSGTTLRMAAVDIQTGKTRYFNEWGMIFDEDVTTLVNEPDVDIHDAAIASASIPFFFPPRELHQSQYVDGGVRAFAPVWAAYKFAKWAYGGDPVTIYLIIGHPPVAVLEKPWNQVNSVDIGSQAMNIMAEDVIEKEAKPKPNGWDVSVKTIRPTMKFPDSLQVDPGLIRIYLDYGYMRAWDVIGAPDPAAAMQLTDAIISLRLRLWEDEQQLWQVPYIMALDTIVTRFKEVRNNKRLLLRKIVERVLAGGEFPPTFSKLWWTYWEEHPWPTAFPPPAGDPWASVTAPNASGSGRHDVVPSETPPELLMRAVVTPAGVQLDTPTDLTIVIRDEATDLAILDATVSIEDQQYNLDATGRLVGIRFTKPAPSIVVSRRGYPTLNVPLTLRLKPLHVSYQIENHAERPPDKGLLRIKVTVTDDAGQAVNATVHLRGPGGALDREADGSWLTYLFESRVITRVNPATGETVVVTAWYPEGWVSADVDGYETQPLNFGYGIPID